MFSSQPDNDNELKRNLTQLLDGSRDLTCMAYVASRLTVLIESGSLHNSENSNSSCANSSDSEEGHGGEIDAKDGGDYSKSGLDASKGLQSEDDLNSSSSDSDGSDNEDDVAEGNVTYPRPVDTYRNTGSRQHHPPLPMHHLCNPTVTCDCTSVYALSQCSVVPNGIEDTNI